MKSEIINFPRKVRRRYKEFQELRYFVKWKDCAEDENIWEPPEGLGKAQELVEEFNRPNPEMPALALVE